MRRSENLPDDVPWNHPHFGGDARQVDCDTCGGDGCIAPEEPTLWERVKAWFGIKTMVACPDCEGEGQCDETEEEFWDAAAEKADRLRDDEIDRQMGL